MAKSLNSDDDHLDILIQNSSLSQEGKGEYSQLLTIYYQDKKPSLVSQRDHRATQNFK